MSPLVVRLGGELRVVGGTAPAESLPPTAPVGLSVSAAGPHALIVSWGPAVVPGGTVTRYELSVDGGAWVTVTSPHIITGLSPETTYSVAVRAVGDDGQAGSAATGEARTTSTGPVEPPTITHGSELPATSDLAEQMIGAQGPLTEYPSGDFTGAMGPVVIENAVFTNKNIRIRSGAKVTLRNCRIIGPFGSNAYTVRINEGGGAWLLMEDCTIVCRTATGDRYPVSGWGDTSLCMRRCVIRGGIDGVHYHGGGAAIWPTGDPLIPMATMLMEECWLGDNERLPGSHSDLVQMAGNRPNRITNYVWLRCRFMGYSLPMYSDTLTTRADPATSGMASACWIDSTGGKGLGAGATRMAFRKNWVEGGNYMFAGSGEDASPSAITDNLFAPKANFGATTGLTGWENRNNRWAYDGTLNNGTVCVGGALISGSSED